LGASCSNKFKIAAKIRLPLKQQAARLVARYEKFSTLSLVTAAPQDLPKLYISLIRAQKSGNNMQNRHILPLHEDTTDIS
jgi:hypothetical protein